MSRDPKLWLDDIRLACEHILDFAAGLDAAGITADLKTRSAIERQLFIIGEAVKQLPDPIKIRFAEVEWREIARFRDLLAHGYWKVDPDLLWTTVEEDIPMLRGQVVRILEILR